MVNLTRLPPAVNQFLAICLLHVGAIFTAWAGPGDVWLGESADSRFSKIRITQIGETRFRMDYLSRGCSSQMAATKWSESGGAILEGDFSERVISGRCPESSRIHVKFPMGSNDGTWEITPRFSLSAVTGIIPANQSAPAAGGRAAGTSIADAFHANSVEAIKRYSAWSKIVLTVRSIEVHGGDVNLSDVQIPASVTQASRNLQSQPFSWDSFHNVAVAGNNVYEQQYRIICVVPLDTFGKMSVNQGAGVSIEGKLRSFADKTIVFDCK